jgi:Ring finger domain
MSKDIELTSISEEANVVLTIEDDTNDICVICLEDYEDDGKGEPIHFSCGHIFHIHCIFDWMTSLFRNNSDISCPICRSIECKSNSPLYVQLRRSIFPIEQSYNFVGIRNNEVQRRVHEDIPQRVSEDSEQQQPQQNNQLEDGLFKFFMKFVMFLSVLGIAFLFYLIYTIGHR